jgi:hypothetical protein
MAAIVVPMLLTGGLIALDMRTDLSDLKARPSAHVDGFQIVGWSDLRSLTPGQPVQAAMLGYMMDGPHPVADGTPVETFALLPDAGHWLHPAHREADESVEVWLPVDLPIRYSGRKLIEVSGMLLRKPGHLREGEAGYTLANAEVRFAGDRRIMEWLQP